MDRLQPKRHAHQRSVCEVTFVIRHPHDSHNFKPWQWNSERRPGVECLIAMPETGDVCSWWMTNFVLIVGHSNLYLRLVLRPDPPKSYLCYINLQSHHPLPIVNADHN